jgi:hypothetical protein
MRQQWPASQRLQDLGKIRTHSSALSGGKNDNTDFGSHDCMARPGKRGITLPAEPLQ